MMVVVPAFAEGEHTEDDVIAAFILAAKGSATPQMANRVDAPCDVMHQENASQSSPQEAEQGTHPTHGEQSTENRRDQKAHQNPKREEIADGAEHRAGGQIGHIFLQAGSVRFKEPATVGVPQALDESDEPVTVKMRGMRVFIGVGGLVVPAMRRHPLEERSFNRQRPEESKEPLDRRAGLERLMGKQPVIADGDAKDRDHVHAEHQAQLDPAKTASPQEGHGRDQSQERHDDGHQIGDLHEKRDFFVAARIGFERDLGNGFKVIFGLGFGNGGQGR